MMLFDHATFQSMTLAKLHIWRCQDGCGFHLRVGGIILTFTVEELAAFLHAAGACYLGEECAHLESKVETPRSDINQVQVPDSESEKQVLASLLEH